MAFWEFSHQADHFKGHPRARWSVQVGIPVVAPKRWKPIRTDFLHVAVKMCFFFGSLGAQNLYLFKGDWGVYLGCWGVYLGWPRNTIDIPGRLPRVAEWMIRGAHTPFLRIQTALFGIIWYIISYQLIYHIISRLFFLEFIFEMFWNAPILVFTHLSKCQVALVPPTCTCGATKREALRFWWLHRPWESNGVHHVRTNRYMIKSTLKIAR